VPADDQLRAAILRSFGARLRELRVAAGLSQADLAHSACLHPTYVSGIERGRRNVSLVNVYLLAAALGLPPAELLPGGTKDLPAR
jgi:transcriptional regulator with XRE-family HTH domain